MKSGVSTPAVDSLKGGLDLLKLFGPEQAELTLSEIARASGRVPSTALRFIHTLVELGYLEENPSTMRYRPANAVLTVGVAALASSGLVAASADTLRELANDVQGLAGIWVADRSWCYLLDSRGAGPLAHFQLFGGARFPLDGVCAGRLLKRMERSSAPGDHEFGVDEIAANLATLSVPVATHGRAVAISLSRLYASQRGDGVMRHRGSLEEAAQAIACRLAAEGEAAGA